MPASKFVEARRVQMLESGELPLCACGCLEFVNLKSDYRPAKFIRGHRVSRWDDLDTIDIQTFRRALFELKSKKGWSLATLADRGGLSLDHLSSLLYDKRKRRVTKDLAENFLRRCVGLPAAPSPRDRKATETRIKIDSVASRRSSPAYNLDYLPPAV
jgi:transcriptional regulator with XRE-family HTH domain